MNEQRIKRILEECRQYNQKWKAKAMRIPTSGMIQFIKTKYNCADCEIREILKGMNLMKPPVFAKKTAWQKVKGKIKTYRHCRV